MSTREEVIAKLSFVTHRSGVGSSGTRNISGTTIHHKELEKTLACWHKQDAALVFNSAYMANFSTLCTIGRQIPNLIFLSDEKNHASIVEGIRASGNQKCVFKHNDVAHLASLLAKLPISQPKMVVFESVYSINGNIAPIAAILSLAKKYNALTYIDEVHGVGLYGNSGAGMVEQLQLEHQVDFINGTLSKAIGVFGGYIAASSTAIDFIRSFGSGFIFTTSIPPAICAAANKSIQLIQQEKESRVKLFEQVAFLRSQLEAYGVPYLANESHITCVPIGNAKACKVLADQLLLEQGIYAQPINSPTVPIGEECLRLIVTKQHQVKHIQHCAFSLNKLGYGKKNKISGQGFSFVDAADAVGE